MALGCMSRVDPLPMRGPLRDPRPQVAGTASAFPPYRYRQEELAEAAVKLVPGLEHEGGLVRDFFGRVGVGARHLALPLDAYEDLGGLESRNHAWLAVATDLGEKCLASLFRGAGIEARDVSMLMTTTVTGVAVPSLDARLMNRLPLRRDLKRMPLFGLGCLGGAAGIARAAEYVRSFPDELAVLLSVELCSLTFQRDDFSVANVVSSGLFGDGAAAVLLAGARHPLAHAGPHAAPHAAPCVIDSRSAFFPDTERVMGWDVVDEGFRVVLDRSVPQVVARELPPAVDDFLALHELRRSDIATWVSHPGGPAVMDAMERHLGLEPDALAPSRRALAEVGNLSSASVLCLLDEFRREHRPCPGAHGLLIAMGPGFCAEMVLLGW